MLPLYKMAEEYMQLFNSIEDEEIPDDLAQRLDAIEGDIEHKANNVVRYIRILDGESSCLEGEIRYLRQKLESRQKKIAWYKSYLFAALQRVGMQKIKSATHTTYIQKNSRPTFDLINERKIPADYQKVSVSFDKEKAYGDYKNGLLTDPESLGIVVQQGYHLQIR